MNWSGEQYKCRKCGEVYPYRLSTCSCGGVCDKIADAPHESSSGLNFDDSILSDILDDEKQKEQERKQKEREKEQERKQKEREKCEKELAKLFSAVKDACSKNDYAAAISYLERILEIAPDSMNAKNLLDFCKNKVEEQRREEAKRHAGERNTVTVNGVEFAFRWAPAGAFTMGSPASEEGRSSGETQHKVTLTKGFWMMETEVTVGMFKAFVSDTGYESKGDTPYGWTGSTWERNSKYSWRNPGFSQNDNHPVTCVSWYDAVEFCKWLGKKTGQNITLPSEAQWEYSCRAETTGAYAGSLDEMAWYNGNSGTHPVGTKKPNAWGLYDMHGNVWEWCQDWKADYSSGSVTAPTGPSSGSFLVYRGGCWNNDA